MNAHTPAIRLLNEQIEKINDRIEDEVRQLRTKQAFITDLRTIKGAYEEAVSHPKQRHFAGTIADTVGH